MLAGLIQQFKEALATHSCRGHVGPDMSERNFSWTCFDDKRPQDPGLGHADVIAFLAGDAESVALKHPDEDAVVNGNEFSWFRHARRTRTTAQLLSALEEAIGGSVSRYEKTRLLPGLA